MKRTAFILSLIGFIYACNINQSGKRVQTQKIVITSDSCNIWGQPPVNFELESLNNYIVEYNPEVPPAGHFYLQLRKLAGDTILQEISFAHAGGLTPENILQKFILADSVTKETLTQVGQIYTTDFIGLDDFMQGKSYQVRARVKFKSLSRGKLLVHGEYSCFMTCIFSQTNPEGAIIVSVISSLNEPLDKANNLSISNQKILNTIKVY